MGTGFVLIIAWILLPYIMSVQKNIIKVFDHIWDIDSNNIKIFL